MLVAGTWAVWLVGSTVFRNRRSMGKSEVRSQVSEPKVRQETGAKATDQRSVRNKEPLPRVGARAVGNRSNEVQGLE